jgi:hypothetical protein
MNKAAMSAPTVTIIVFIDRLNNIEFSSY